MFSLIASVLNPTELAEFRTALQEFEAADLEAKQLDRTISGALTPEQKELHQASNKRFWEARRQLAKFGADPFTF